MWTIEGDESYWESSRFAASVSLSHPHQGLSRIRVFDQLISEIRLFGFTFGNLAPENAESVQDVYKRGNDLVVTYIQTPDRPVRTQIYWRVLDGIDELGVEMIISTQTSLLESNPSVTVTSRVPTSSLRRLVEPLTGLFDSVAMSPRDSQMSIDANSGTPLMLFRLQNCEWSYVQLIDPSDFLGACLSSDDEGSIVELRQQLFSERLEKGVIRRGRAWGLFVPRADDEKLATSVFNRLVAEAPPLTT